MVRESTFLAKKRGESKRRASSLRGIKGGIKKRRMGDRFFTLFGTQERGRKGERGLCSVSEKGKKRKKKGRAVVRSMFQEKKKGRKYSPNASIPQQGGGGKRKRRQGECFSD